MLLGFADYPAVVTVLYTGAETSPPKPKIDPVMKANVLYSGTCSCHVRQITRPPGL